MGVNGTTPDEIFEEQASRHSGQQEVKDEITGSVDSIEPTKPKSSRRRSITIFIVVSALNVALLALLWTQLLTPAQNSSKIAANSSNVYGDANVPLLGKPAPNFTLSMLNGPNAQVRLADFKGKPVVLNFWASWCDPCKAEAPFLAKNVPGLQSQGVVFVGVNSAQEPKENALQFLEKYKITYTNVFDGDGATAINYGITTYPMTLFINRSGIVTAAWNTTLTEDGWKFELAKITK